MRLKQKKMGLSELEELQQRCARLEHLYDEAVKARNEAIEERDKATVLIALHLESETEELSKQIETLQNQSEKLSEENEDLKIRLEYAKDDLNKLQQRHILLQIEQEKCLQEKEDALALLKEFEEKKELFKSDWNNNEVRMSNERKNPAYSNVRGEIFTSASETDLELEPRPPVMLKSSRLEDFFDIHDEIGKGKFGVVKKVTERSSQKVYAAKYIRLSSSGSGSAREDIMREINIMNQLHHKRLVGLVDAFDLPGKIVMIMEFVSGGELFERVADADCLTEKEASFYMYQLLQGLQYMHSKNIVHLDLKPENIVCVSKDSWDIKLIDFGLAQELVLGVRMKALKGTPEFMAPEAVNFEAISLATDMWSVGVIAYILLSGLSPLLGDDNNETLVNVTAAEWDFDDESFDVISDEAKEFISKLLVKSPRKRNTVKQSLEHEWMKKSASANAVKIDTKKLKHFLAKRRWQKSVNALVAVRRLSSMTSLLNVKNRPSAAPSLATVPSGKEEEDEEDSVDEGGKELDKKPGLNGNHVDQEASVALRPPAIDKQLVDMSINEGETVSLEVVIRNSSDCQLEWFKDDTELKEGGRLSFHNNGDGRYSLTIRDTEDDDSGEYCCAVQNEAGRITCTAKLSVQVLSKSEETEDEEHVVDSSIEVPVFTKELHDVTANERDIVTLEVVVSGNSPYELEWFKNAVEVTESERISLVTHDNGRYTLFIRDCEDDDTGEYCCVAQNEAGRVTCAGWLTVEVESVESEGEDESGESEDDDVFVPKEFVKVREDDVHKFFCIEEEVGRGRFGIVKKCVELETATRFCAKFIKSRPSQKEEFKREIDVMNALHHPRLIRLYDAFEEPRRIVLIMEYARGDDLCARIDGDSLPEFEAVKILKQVLEGVKFMHDNGFMHLDLKPQNVMFKNEGGSKIKLIDFSLTRKFDPEQETKISFGTAEYVAPEIVNYEPATLSADMWAIGVIAYIMLSGESPFLGESEAETFNRITEGRWEFSDVFDYVSKEAKDFILRLLVKEPKQRMTVDECLQHEWIKSPGFTGKKKSKHFPESELAFDDTSNVSPTEKKRLESRISEEQETTLDEKKLESKLKELVSKLQNAERENQLLEAKLRDEEERSLALEEELHTNEIQKKELEGRVSKLETEKVYLSKKAKSNSDVLKRVTETEGEKRTLEDELSEKSKNFETLSQKYNSLKERMDHYDVLEEKVYLLERERKEYQETKKDFEEKLGYLRTEKDELIQKNKKNALTTKALQEEIAELKEDKNKFESQYNTLLAEKESLLQELTKRFEVSDEQRKSLSQEKINLQTTLNKLEKENKDLKLNLEDVAREKELSKDSIAENSPKREKYEMQKQLDEIKKQYEETQKTCEDLASKLSKAYAELEKTTPTTNHRGSADQQEDIATLREKVSNLERDRENLEDDLDDKEAELDELKKKMEQLETDNIQKAKDLQNLKVKLEDANQELTALREETAGKGDGKQNSSKRGEDVSKEVYVKRVEEYKSMVEKLTKEVSGLQGRLLAANQKNKDLEENVTRSKQAKPVKPVVEREFVARNENQLESASVPDNECYVGNKDVTGQIENSEVVKDVSESQRNMELKQDFERLKLFTEELETKLAKEIERKRSLEEQVKNFEMEKQRGIKMYQELEEECNRLRDELDENASSPNEVEVRLRERLRERLKSKEAEIDVLSKQIESLKREVQTIKEERDKGDSLYVSLAEKYKNLLKENKILEQEKQERIQQDQKSREMEETMQTRINELMQMKDEIESMRDNLRTVVREKEMGIKEYTTMQNDLAKLRSDRQELEDRVRDEVQRADKLERERCSLQEKVQEMQKDVTQRDLVTAADKKTINTYADEIKILREEKVNADKKAERLRKDLETLSKEREDAGSLRTHKENALREVEILRNENRQLLQRIVEFDQMKEDYEHLRRDLEKMNRACESLPAFKSDKERAATQIEILRKENLELLEKVDEVEHTREELESLKKEKAVGVNKITTLTEEHKQEINRLEDDLEVLKHEKQDIVNQLEVLSEENRRLLLKVDEFMEMEDDYKNFRARLEQTDRAMEDVRHLKTENENAQKEIEILRNENGQLVRRVEQFDDLSAELDKLKQEKVVGLEKMYNLGEENQDLLEKVREMEDILEDVERLRNDKQNATKEINLLKERNETLLKEQEEAKTVHLNFSSLSTDRDRLAKENETLKKEIEQVTENNKEVIALRSEKCNLLNDVERLNEEKEKILKEYKELNLRGIELEDEKTSLANDIKTIEKAKEDLRTLKEEQEKGLVEMEHLKRDKSSLLQQLESLQGIKENLNTALKENKFLKEKKENLEMQLDNQALEAMKFRKETTTLKKKIGVLTKDFQRLQEEKSRCEEEISASWKADMEKMELMAMDLKRLQEETTSHQDKQTFLIEKVRESTEPDTREIKTLKEEIGFLEKEVEDLSEENRDLLQSYKGLQKENGCLKEEFSTVKKCLEMKANELQSATNERDALEKRRFELEQELQSSTQELQEIRKDYEPQKERLKRAEKEIEDFIKENEELHQNYVDLEEKYDRIRKLNRELEEDVDIESNNFAEAKGRIEELNKSNANLRQRITKMQHEISKLRGISETGSEEHGGVDHKVQHFEKNKTIVQSRREQLEARLIEEELKTSKFGDANRKIWNRVQSMDSVFDKEGASASIEREVRTLRSSKERANALEKELRELKEKLDFEVKNGEIKAEEINLKKKENDSLIYELESTRHRLVSNVLNPLEKAVLPGKVSVSAADISAGKSKAWSSIKESILTLIREYERLRVENSSFLQESSPVKQDQHFTKESDHLAKEGSNSPQKMEQTKPSLRSPTIEDIAEKKKHVQALHQKLATDEENLALVKTRNKELLRRIEFMKRMQFSTGQDEQKQEAQKSLSSSFDGRVGPDVPSEFKHRRLHTVEGISVTKHVEDIEELHRDDLMYDKRDEELSIVPREASDLETTTTQWSGNEQVGDSSEEEQIKFARELVKKNRRIFELEQEVEILLKKIEDLSPEKITLEKLSIDVEKFRLEILRLEAENKSLKELTNDATLASSKKQIETLEAMNNFLKSEKEELLLQISAKNKKIDILEMRVNELTDIKTNMMNGSKNGVCGEADDDINELDEELRTTKYKVAELEAELEHFNNSYNSKLKRELDEIEAKWTKRLRKECMDLQSELSEKHSKEKQQWQKKEVELQNIIRQMKIVMDKKLGQAESERRKLEQQLRTAKSVSSHGSSVSLDSNSDDSGESPSSTPGRGNTEISQNDCLSDRELRRVAYKLNGEEWSQLGTFLGVEDSDLFQLGGLTMGPQEKAFRLLCVWRTRCRLSRSQMISQLAVSLEEVNRKDVAQFVLEQFMSGKPRKKLFGW